MSESQATHPAFRLMQCFISQQSPDLAAFVLQYFVNLTEKFIKEHFKILYRFIVVFQPNIPADDTLDVRVSNVTKILEEDVDDFLHLVGM